MSRRGRSPGWPGTATYADTARDFNSCVRVRRLAWLDTPGRLPMLNAMNTRKQEQEPDTGRETLLTVADLAVRYGVSKSAVYQWNSMRTGPKMIKPGGRGSVCRYRLSDVLAWEKTRYAA